LQVIITTFAKFTIIAMITCSKNLKQKRSEILAPQYFLTANCYLLSAPDHLVTIH